MHFWLVELLVIGGGCSGTFHSERLLTAIGRGLIEKSELVIVDRNSENMATGRFAGRDGVTFVRSDWSTFLRGYFEKYSPGAGSRLIPAHMAPHLLFEVAASHVAARTGSTVEMEPVTASFGLPFDKEGEKGIRYISAAAWLCPFSCIEPGTCPATRGPRDWDLSVLVPQVMKSKADLSVVFKTTHFAWGVGAISCDSIISAYEGIVELARNKNGRSMHVAVATTSNCHGVVGMLKVN